MLKQMEDHYVRRNCSYTITIPKVFCLFMSFPSYYESKNLTNARICNEMEQKQDALLPRWNISSGAHQIEYKSNDNRKDHKKLNGPHRTPILEHRIEIQQII